MKNSLVRVSTNYGDFTIELNAKQAPKTVANFLQYVSDGHYNGTIFHRVISNFMIQGGGFLPEMKEKPTRDPIDNEASAKLKNEMYTVAMARTTEPHSATSQFFINVQDNAFLDFKSATAQGWGYCVFGKVIEGESVIDDIKMQPTTRFGFHQDVPKRDIVIKSIEAIS
ncbi:MAG: peptidyl-prolyl cis-trans isomerase [Burkholderiales bacterium]|jgi:peptidyl-prolyl cis-trans isomerase B (cyclophilin B)|nr:peptidyl-prolyl cis-trans isomerase [Burkholderiales bacterium]